VDTAQNIFVPKHKRRIGYIFQDARLFPHMTVRQNLLFGRWFAPRKESAETLESITALLGIAPLLDRSPRTLSGGEKQRVAIGRALLANPRLLLMDEPLASLDNQRKDEIVPYIERLRDEMRIPIVFVSHATAEVARLATTVVTMAKGRVTAVGTVSKIMSRPGAAPASERSETSAVLETKVLSHDDEFHLTRLDSAAGLIRVARVQLAPGTPVRVRIRARDVMLAIERPSAISALNVLYGTVAEMGPEDGASRDIRIGLGGQDILANLTLRSIADLRLAPGRPVYAVIKSVAIEGAAKSAG
jgi:molybdate transport system ATP-binding protein